MTTTAQTQTAETTAETKTTKIRPSSAAFMSGPLVDTTKNSGCLRFQWTEHWTNPPKIERVDPAYAGLGALNEERFAAKLRRKRLKYDREYAFKFPYGEDARISGRYDFDVHYKTGTVLTELKASTSDYVKKAIETGEADWSHVAQLALYMALHKREEGHLWNAYYQLSPDQDAFVVTAERQFVLKLSTDGEITVDGKIFPRSLQDLRRWLQATKAAASDPSTIPPGPKDNPIPYKSACYSCPLKVVCETHKTSEYTAPEFLAEAKTALSAPVTPRPFKISTQRKKGESTDEE